MEAISNAIAAFANSKASLVEHCYLKTHTESNHVQSSTIDQVSANFLNHESHFFKIKYG